MKFYWTKHKRGDHLLVITSGDLHDIIQKQCRKWFFGGNATFGGTLEEIFEFLKDRKEKALWIGLSHRIISDIENNKPSCPFEHLEENKLTKIFWRYKLGGTRTVKELLLLKLEYNFLTKPYHKYQIKKYYQRNSKK